MTLFSLLLVMLAERLRLWQSAFQFERFSAAYIQRSGADKPRHAVQLLLLALLPAIAVALLTEILQGQGYGLPNLILWIAVGLLLFGHSAIRQRFRQFLSSACSGDLSRCHGLVQQLDACHQQDKDEHELGQHMGELAAWINFRYYAVVALYFVAFGPAAALFYSLVRDIHDHHSRQGQARLTTLLHLLDWIPARLISVSFAFAGRFSHAMAVLLPDLLSLSVPARQVVINVAVAAEEIPEKSTQPICIQSTLAMLKLVKRNLILLLVLVSFLTIFGVLQ
ncbi:beta-lactamase regulator AmpE [uncultured Ferrimonas sp.]|uniref:beta-lactamase regulator AmpE n=1 Tax=uncultured Ferrimonas sp. TaxID=432640 RepID=UPI0026303316|nr:beta-lactamase regulator AmpE [uncultured Ferrimonas sp.]